MSSDVIEIYELNLQKNYDLLDTQISKSMIYEDEYLPPIIKIMDNLLSQISKTTKDYTVALNLTNTIKSPILSYKIKRAEDNLKSYTKKVEDIKEKEKNKAVKIINIPEYENNISKQKDRYDTFSKMNQAIRTSYEIENISGNVLLNLNEQSNTMKNDIQKIGNLNGDLESSKDYLNSMINKENYDRKIILIFGFVLSMITILILIFKIYYKFSHTK